MKFRPRKRQIPVLLLLVILVTTVILGNHIQLAYSYSAANPVPISAKFFGMHMHSAHAKTPWPSVPFSSWRLWDASVAWPHLEGKKGEWNFARLDRYLELAEQHQVEIVLPLGLTPQWASARPTEPSAYSPIVGDDGRAAPPKNIEDWRNYVRTVATRYQGRIRTYEIWNEPNVKGFYTGTVDEMVTLTREAYQILKGIDPEITVVTPAASGGDAGPNWIDGTSWLEEFLSKGGGTYADVIGYHFYVIPEPPEAISPLIVRVQKLIEKYGLTQKPLWNTELGWFYPKIFTRDSESAAYVARSYILNAAQGVERLYWYSWDGASNGILPMIDPEDRGQLKPAGIAYGEVQKWLVGNTINGCNEGKNGWTCLLEYDGGDRAWVVWNPYGDIFFDVPENWPVQQMRELSGATSTIEGSRIRIGELPILLEP